MGGWVVRITALYKCALRTCGDLCRFNALEALENMGTWFETSSAPIQESLGPLGPECPRECLTECPRNPGCPTECSGGVPQCPKSVPRVSPECQKLRCHAGMLSGHFLDTHEPRAGHSVGHPIFGDTPSDTPGDTGARRVRETPVGGRRCLKSW